MSHTKLPREIRLGGLGLAGNGFLYGCFFGNQVAFFGFSVGDGLLLDRFCVLHETSPSDSLTMNQYKKIIKSPEELFLRILQVRGKNARKNRASVWVGWANWLTNERGRRRTEKLSVEGGLCIAGNLSFRTDQQSLRGEKPVGRVQ